MSPGLLPRGPTSTLVKPTCWFVMRIWAGPVAAVEFQPPQAAPAASAPRTNATIVRSIFPPLSRYPQALPSSPFGSRQLEPEGRALPGCAREVHVSSERDDDRPGEG